MVNPLHTTSTLAINLTRSNRSQGAPTGYQAPLKRPERRAGGVRLGIGKPQLGLDVLTQNVDDLAIKERFRTPAKTGAPKTSIEPYPGPCAPTPA